MEIIELLNVGVAISILNNCCPQRTRRKAGSYLTILACCKVGTEGSVKLFKMSYPSNKFVKRRHMRDLLEVGFFDEEKP